MKKKSTKNNVLITSGIIAGVVAAGAAGYLLFGPNGKKNRKKMQSWMMEAKAEIVAQAEKFKASTREEFGDIIDGVMEHYTTAKKITVKEAKALKDELLDNWEQVALMLVKGKYKKAEDFIASTVKAKALETGKKVVSTLSEKSAKPTPVNAKRASAKKGAPKKK